MNQMNELNPTKEKILIFISNKIPVHVQKINRHFNNGYFVREISPNLFLFKDFKCGEIFIHLSEVFEISKYQSENNFVGELK